MYSARNEERLGWRAQHRQLGPDDLFNILRMPISVLKLIAWCEAVSYRHSVRLSVPVHPQLFGPGRRKHNSFGMDHLQRACGSSADLLHVLAKLDWSFDT